MTSLRRVLPRLSLYTRISVIIVIVVIDDIVLVVLGVIISPLRFSAKSEPVLHTAQKTHSQCLAHMKQAPRFVVTLECLEVIVKNPSTNANHGGAFLNCHGIVFRHAHR